MKHEEDARAPLEPPLAMPLIHLAGLTNTQINCNTQKGGNRIIQLTSVTTYIFRRWQIQKLLRETPVHASRRPRCIDASLFQYLTLPSVHTSTVSMIFVTPTLLAKLFYT